MRLRELEAPEEYRVPTYITFYLAHPLFNKSWRGSSDSIASHCLALLHSHSVENHYYKATSSGTM